MHNGARDTEAAIWLARCFVGESDFKAHRDHIAIRYVLHHRARQMAERHGWSFTQTVRRYCAGLGTSTPSARQTWIRALPPLDRIQAPPQGWPSNLSWRARVELWRAALRLASEPPTRPSFCKLAPHHWGGAELPRDVQRAAKAIREGRWVDAECEGTVNNFYSLRVKR